MERWRWRPWSHRPLGRRQWSWTGTFRGTLIGSLYRGKHCHSDLVLRPEPGHCFVCSRLISTYICTSIVSVIKFKGFIENILGNSFRFKVCEKLDYCCSTYIERPLSPLLAFYKSCPIFLKALNQFTPPNIMQRKNVMGRERKNINEAFIHGAKPYV